MTIDEMKKALLEKRANELPANNEDQSTVGVNNVSAPVPFHPGQIEVPWGTDPKLDRDGHLVVNSEAATREDKVTRVDLLGKLFDVFPNAAKADQALIRENFGHSGELHAHSPLLNKEGSAPPTLRERVRKLI